jgi:hypothetical protein
LTSRQTTFNILRSNKLVGMILSNWFHEHNGKIALEWLNKSKLTFKTQCKIKFLTYPG